jgi:hypothetical protein
MQSLSVILQSHLPTLAGAGHEPTLPPLAHLRGRGIVRQTEPRRISGMKGIPKSAFSQYRMGTFLLGRQK